MKPKLLAQGAEAKIYLVTPTDQVKIANEDQDQITNARVGGGDRENLPRERGHTNPTQIIHKNRIPKSYRHPALDKQIRTRRTRSEGKILTKALAAGTLVPEVFNINKKGAPTDKFELKIQYIPGDRLSETLSDYPEEKQFKVMKQLGAQVAILHGANIIHGDLTTSNTILSTTNTQNSSLHVGDLKRDEVAGSRQATKKSSKFTSTKSPRESDSDSQNKRSEASPVEGGLGGESESNKIYIIDFGLGFISRKIEDKAVDLHLIKQALEAKHWQNHEDLFKEFTKGYTWTESKKALERLVTVERRGRYKH